MNLQFSERFKSAVERNFDRSAQTYDAFEARHGLFERIAARLAAFLDPATPATRILDVGCGTGISTAVLARRFGPGSRIVGLDLSRAMLDQAAARLRAFPNVVLCRGDAEHLAACVEGPFDAVFYNACIFLIPDFRKSIGEAAGLLSGRGVILISTYRGLCDIRGDDPLARCGKGIPYKFGVVPTDDLISYMNALEAFYVRAGEYRIEAAPGMLYDFLAIPAQSAGLYPRLSYEERLPRIRELCERLAAEEGGVFMNWTLISARRTGSESI